VGLLRKRSKLGPEDLAEQRLASEQANARLARREAARRYGGVDLAASFGGALAALGSVVLMGSVAASIGWIRYAPTRDHSRIELSVAGVVTAGVVLFAAFLLGSWAAGRMARYDGGRNGLLTAVWFVALVAITAGIGVLANHDYNVLQTVQAPRWLSDNAWTAKGIILMGCAVALMLIAASIGGRVGERYHRHPDDVIAATGARHEIDPDVDLRVPAVLAPAAPSAEAEAEAPPPPPLTHNT
jgi:hypothetical protein